METLMMLSLFTQRGDEMAAVQKGDVVKVGGRDFTVVDHSEIEAQYTGLIQNTIDNGWEPAYYFLQGKRGANATCYRSVKTGEFHRIW